MWIPLRSSRRPCQERAGRRKRGFDGHLHHVTTSAAYISRSPDSAIARTTPWYEEYHRSATPPPTDSGGERQLRRAASQVFECRTRTSIVRSAGGNPFSAVHPRL